MSKLAMLKLVILCIITVSAIASATIMVLANAPVGFIVCSGLLALLGLLFI